MCALVVEITYDSVDGNPETTVIAGCQIGVLERGRTGRWRVDVLGTELYNSTCFNVGGNGGLDSIAWNSKHGNIVFNKSTLLFYLSNEKGTEKLFVRYPPADLQMDQEVYSGQSFQGFTFKII